MYPLCLGGCGAQVGEGQKCPACAAAAVDEWLDGIKKQFPHTWELRHQFAIERLTAQQKREYGGRDTRKRRES